MTLRRDDDETTEVLEALGLEPLRVFYGHFNSDDSSPGGDYAPLLRSFGYDVLLKLDEDGYQGDTMVLYRQRHTGAYGFLVFGWGSCGGCDALQACHTWVEAEDLRRRLMRSIVWKPTAREMLVWLLADDVQELKHYWSMGSWHDFRRDAARLLAADGGA